MVQKSRKRKQTRFICICQSIGEWCMTRLNVIGQRCVCHVVLIVRFVKAEGHRQLPAVEEVQHDRLQGAIAISGGKRFVCIHRNIRNGVSDQFVSFLQLINNKHCLPCFHSDGRRHRRGCTIRLSLFYWPFSRWTGVSRHQNVSILDFIGAKDDGSGGNNWSHKTCKGPVKLSPPTNQHPACYTPDALPVGQRPGQPIVVNALKGNYVKDISLDSGQQSQRTSMRTWTI